LKICNGLFTFLDPRYVDLYALEEDVLQWIVEDISRCYLIFHSSLKYLDMILSSFGDMILTRDPIVNLKTIVDHCPQNFENHRKTIGSNGWTPKKTFNGDGPTLSKPLKNHWRQWWPKKNINHSIALKNWPSLWSTTGSWTTKISRSKLVEVNGTATTGAMSTQEGVRMRLFPRKQAGSGQKLPVKNMTTYGFKI